MRRPASYACMPGPANFVFSRRMLTRFRGCSQAPSSHCKKAFFRRLYARATSRCAAASSPSLSDEKPTHTSLDAGVSLSIRSSSTPERRHSIVPIGLMNCHCQASNSPHTEVSRSGRLAWHAHYMLLMSDRDETFSKHGQQRNEQYRSARAERRFVATCLANHKTHYFSQHCLTAHQTLARVFGRSAPDQMLVKLDIVPKTRGGPGGALGEASSRVACICTALAHIPVAAVK